MSVMETVRPLQHGVEDDGRGGFDRSRARQEATLKKNGLKLHAVLPLSRVLRVLEEGR